MRFWIGIAIFFYGMLGLAVTLGLLGVQYLSEETISNREASVVILVIIALPIPAVVVLAGLHFLAPGVLGRFGIIGGRLYALLILLPALVLLAGVIWLLNDWSDELPGGISPELMAALIVAGGVLLAIALIALLVLIRINSRD
jgi:hypothetical protein